MTWYTGKKRVDPETENNYLKAKANKGIRPIINCPICFGKGEKYDSKLGKIRDCAACKATGLIKNPKYNHTE